MAKVKLVSADQEEFEVDVEVATASNVIKTMWENLGAVEENSEETVLVPNVNANILKLVIEWAKHHLGPEKLENKELEEWDKKFMDRDKYELFEITRAANFLDIEGLLDACTSAVARLMEGKTSAEIRKLFDLDTQTN